MNFTRFKFFAAQSGHFARKRSGTRREARELRFALGPASSGFGPGGRRHGALAAPLREGNHRVALCDNRISLKSQ
jgi:hypothetical protein